jgi:PPP4R2
VPLCAQIGPPPALPGGETAGQLRKRLRLLLESFEDGAPFTVQRLAEVLLEPQKQYTRLDKLVRARGVQLIGILPCLCESVQDGWHGGLASAN